MAIDQIKMYIVHHLKVRAFLIKGSWEDLCPFLGWQSWWLAWVCFAIQVLLEFIRTSFGTSRSSPISGDRSSSFLPSLRKLDLRNLLLVCPYYFYLAMPWLSSEHQSMRSPVNILHPLLSVGSSGDINHTFEYFFPNFLAGSSFHCTLLFVLGPWYLIGHCVKLCQVW